jgi:hypothetical protein
MGDKELGDMARILEQEPQLSDFGFGVFDPMSKTLEEREVELRKEREAICQPRSLAQFIEEWKKRGFRFYLLVPLAGRKGA